MKIRLGFVSNSSSASFIIKLKGSYECPWYHRSSKELKTILDELVECGCENTNVLARGKSEVKEYIKESYSSARGEDWACRLKELIDNQEDEAIYLIETQKII